MSESPRLRRPERKSWSEVLKVWGPLLALAAIGFAVAISQLEPPPPRTLKIAAGSPGGAYYAYAERYRKILARDDFELELVATAGSVENLSLLESGEVALGLLQGGVRPKPHEEASADELESLASLFFEPVWVFHPRGEPVELLSDLAGRRIAIGQVGSGTRVLALQLLADNGVDASTAELLEIPSDEAAAALEDGTIDAAIFVTSAESTVVRRLIAQENLELMSVRRSLAYRKAHPYLSAVLLGQGVIDIDADLPRQDVTLVAAAASLVARGDLHHALVPLFLGAMKEVHGKNSLLETPHGFPGVDLVDYDLKVEAEHYLVNGPSFLLRYLGFWAATAIDRLKILLLPLITLVLPVFKVAPPIYRWRIRSKIYRWYEDLRWSDEILHDDPSPEEIAAHLESVRQLEREVSQVEVPLSYMEEYYSLRLHVQLILVKLERLARHQGSAPGEGDPGLLE